MPWMLGNLNTYQSDGACCGGELDFIVALRFEISIVNFIDQ